VFNEFGAKGGAVVIDEVNYSAKLCKAGPGPTTKRPQDPNNTTRKPNTSADPACQALYCSFDEGINYKL
jgi:hypothetical protein